MGSEIRIKKLGKMAKIKGGKRMPKGEQLTEAKNLHPYIRVRDITDGYIDKHNLLYVPNSIFPEISKYTVNEGDLIISIVGTIGSVASIDKELHGANLTENAAKILITDPNLNSEYLEYFLRSRQGKYQIRKNSVGSTQPKLPLYGIKNIDVPVPTLEEQKRIAHILGTLDDKIELNQRMNETLEAIARAIFKSWFVDFDPVKAKMIGEPYPLPDAVMALFPDELVESELGMIPKGWEVGTISDISEVMIGGDWGKEEKTNGYNLKVRCLRGTDLEKLRQYGYTNEVPVRWIKKSSYKKRSLNEFDIIIASSGVGPLGRPLWINPWIEEIFDEPTTYSNFTKRIRAKSKNLAIYIDRILYEMHLSEKVWEFSTGTSIPNLDINSLVKNHLILVPNKEIIKSFAQHMLPIYEKLFSNENQTLTIIREEYSLNIFSQM